MLDPNHLKVENGHWDQYNLFSSDLEFLAYLLSLPVRVLAEINHSFNHEMILIRLLSLLAVFHLLLLSVLRSIKALGFKPLTCLDLLLFATALISIPLLHFCPETSFNPVKLLTLQT